MTNKVIDIVSATPLRDYGIRLVFDDGNCQTFDFKPFLENAPHPDMRAFLQPAKFADYRIAYGELVRGDYDLCFPIMDLYTNQIDKRSRQEADA